MKQAKSALEAEFEKTKRLELELCERKSKEVYLDLESKGQTPSF